jgi:hypothetical protein
MKTLLLILLPLVMLVFGSLAWALEADYVKYEADPEENLQTQGFGVHSGNGYAWRYMTDKHGFQIVLGGYTSGNNNNHFSNTLPAYNYNPPSPVTDTHNGRKYYVNIGANYIKPLKRTQFTLFYLHAGANWNYSDQRKYTQHYTYNSSFDNYYKVGNPTVSHNISSYVNIGAGPGFELTLGKYVKFAVELPVTYTGKDEFLMYIPQAGLYYYFK